MYGAPGKALDWEIQLCDSSVTDDLRIRLDEIAQRMSTDPI